MTDLSVACAGRWAEWTGLDAPGEREMASHLGSLVEQRSVPLRGAVYQLSTHAGGEVWRDGAGGIVMVAIAEPPAPDGVAAALVAPGPAAVAQPARFGLLGWATTDHLWPERGLVLVEATRYRDELTPADAVGPDHVLLRAELVAPTSLERWRAEIAPLRWPLPPQRW